MNYLITGASGFKGKHLIKKLLDSGHSVHAIVINESEDLSCFHNIKIYACDLTDSKALNKTILDINKVDGVFHLAALSSVHLANKNPGLTYRTNLEATANLIEALKLIDSPPIIFVSSGEVYGKKYTDEINDETIPAPANIYAFSKYFAEIHLQKSYENYVITRPFSIIGTGQASHFVIPSFCRQTAEIMKGQAPADFIVGNINVKRNFLAIDDAIRAYLLIMNSFKPGTIYNIANNHSLSLKTIIENLEETAQEKFNLKTDKSLLRANDPDIPLIKTTNLQKLNWQPEISIKNQLKEIVEFYLENT